VLWEARTLSRQNRYDKGRIPFFWNQNQVRSLARQISVNSAFPPALSHMICEPVGLTNRFRLPVTRGQPQYPRAGAGQGNSVADGYEDGLPPILSSQDGADRFTLVRQERTIAPAVPRRVVLTNQTTLGTSDRWNIK
jgi:hypothetical protein